MTHSPTCLIVLHPATSHGRTTLHQLFSEEINVNVSLLFGLLRYREVAEAHIKDLEARIAGGKSVKHFASAKSRLAGDGLTDRAFQENTAALHVDYHGRVVAAHEIFPSER